jgi:hypothetical protein
MQRLTLLLAALFPIFCQAQLGGEYIYGFTNPPLWDFSGTYVTTELGLTRTSILNVAPSGTVTGSGNLHYDDTNGIVFNADQTSKGKVTANATLGVRLSVKGSGEFTVDLGEGPLTGPLKGSLNATLDPATRTLNGPIVAKLCIPKAGCETVSTNTTLNLPANMDGTWELTLNVQTSGSSVTGTATVTLSSGRELPYTVTGSYSSSTGISKLKLKGTGEAARTALSTTVDGAGNLLTLKGKLFGQPLLFP